MLVSPTPDPQPRLTAVRGLMANARSRLRARRMLSTAGRAVDSSLIQHNARQRPKSAVHQRSVKCRSIRPKRTTAVPEPSQFVIKVHHREPSARKSLDLEHDDAVASYLEASTPEELQCVETVTEVLFLYLEHFTAERRRRREKQLSLQVSEEETNDTDVKPVRRKRVRKRSRASIILNRGMSQARAILAFAGKSPPITPAHSRDANSSQGGGLALDLGRNRILAALVSGIRTARARQEAKQKDEDKEDDHESTADASPGDEEPSSESESSDTARRKWRLFTFEQDRKAARRRKKQSKSETAEPATPMSPYSPPVPRAWKPVVYESEDLSNMNRASMMSLLRRTVPAAMQVENVMVQEEVPHEVTAEEKAELTEAARRLYYRQILSLDDQEEKIVPPESLQRRKNLPAVPPEFAVAEDPRTGEFVECRWEDEPFHVLSDVEDDHNLAFELRWLKKLKRPDVTEQYLDVLIRDAFKEQRIKELILQQLQQKLESSSPLVCANLEAMMRDVLGEESVSVEQNRATVEGAPAPPETPELYPPSSGDATVTPQTVLARPASSSILRSAMVPAGAHSAPPAMITTPQVPRPASGHIVRYTLPAEEPSAQVSTELLLSPFTDRNLMRRQDGTYNKVLFKALRKLKRRPQSSKTRKARLKRWQDVRSEEDIATVLKNVDERIKKEDSAIKSTYLTGTMQLVAALRNRLSVAGASTLSTRSAIIRKDLAKSRAMQNGRDLEERDRNVLSASPMFYALRRDRRLRRRRPRSALVSRAAPLEAPSDESEDEADGEEDEV